MNKRVCVLIALVAALALFVVTGVLFSGYHLEDDFNQFMFSQYFGEQGVIGGSLAWLKLWLEIRLNPFWWAMTLVRYLVFGNISPMYYAINAILLGLTGALLFAIARKVQYDRWASAFFTLTILIGAQTRAYFRVYAPEPLGLFFLALGLYWLTPKAGRERPQSTIGALACMTLMSLTKESFVLIVPIFALWKIWHDLMAGKKGIVQLVKSNAAIVLYCSALFIAEIGAILAIGTSNLGYAGVGADKVMIADVVLLLKNLFGTSLLAIMPLVGLVAALLIKVKSSGDTTFRRWGGVLIACVIIFPQMILHYKSGMHERYLLPAVLGLGLLNAEAFTLVRAFPKRGVKTGGHLLALVIVLLCLARAVFLGVIYAKEGVETRRLLSDIATLTPKETSILAVNSYPFGNHIASAAMYLRSDLGGKQTVSYQLVTPMGIQLPREHIDSLKVAPKKLLLWSGDFFLKYSFGYNAFNTMTNRDCIATVLINGRSDENLFLQYNQDWFKPEQYTRSEYGKSSGLFNRKIQWNLILYSKVTNDCKGANP